jgi:O-antigen biosynthesis protein
MTSTPLVSVLIRTRDRPALLLEAVKSVALQHYRPLELIVVNDGGLSSAAAVATFCAERSLPLQWLDCNGRGRSAAANTALAAAKGIYCLLLDDDDWLDATHVSGLVTALLPASLPPQSPPAPAVPPSPSGLVAYSDVRTVHANGSINETAFNHPYDALRLRIENYIPIHAVLFARQLFSKGCRFDPALERFEDWDFWLQVAQHTDFLHVPQCTANYRIASDSGFGVKAEEAINQLRVAFYRKWLPRWTDSELQQVLDRCRQYPRLAVLESEAGILKEESATLQKFVRHLQRYEQELTAALTLRNAELQERHVELVTLGQRLSDLEFVHQRLLHDYKMAQVTAGALRHDLNLIYNSRSWKLTRPLRYFNKIQYFLRVEGLGGVLRRARYKLLRRAPRLPKVTATPFATRPGPLQFAEHPQPLISIVIPVFNKSDYSFHCLSTLLQNSGDLAYEVIVVDDCSSDNTTEVLQQIKGIQVIRNDTNRGFIHSCNTGAAAARGEFLLLFNNDTEPQPGWLDALLNTFRDFPDAGMVGAQLLFADGKLQEAGGIVWQDGSAWNFGRGDDPNKPEYSYCRRVDYCSGACLLLRRADYFAWGQFDTHYLPAYYEDTDLAFKVRAARKQVYYQPQARVIHFEGISNGTDTSGGIKAYQVANKEKFFARWESVLVNHRPNAYMPQLEKERHVYQRALVVDARVLMPDNDSGSLRMFNLLKILQSLDYKVTFAPENLYYDERYTPRLQALGIECIHTPYQNSVAQHLEQHGSLYSLIILSRADVAERNINAALRYAPLAKVIFDTVDLHFLRERRLAELSGSKAEAEAAELRRLQELNTARKAHVTLVVSPVEVELFQQEAPDVKVALVSNIHAVHGRSKAWAERENILFIGSFEHPPNVDAMHHFIDDVFPLLQQQRPDIKLLVVGPNAPKALLAKASEHIEFAGFVEDIAPLFHLVRLSIAPLRYGAGVKGKINSSMSFGVPVVASPIAAEGMGLQDGVDVLIADSPQQFADAIVRVYQDEPLWQQLSDASLANLERNFSFEVATKQLKAILGL